MSDGEFQRPHKDYCNCKKGNCKLAKFGYTSVRIGNNPICLLTNKRAKR